MPGDQRAVVCSLMSLDGSKSILGAITMTAVGTEGTEKMHRAVLRIAGEVQRYWVSRHEAAVESIRQLLIRVSHRMADVGKDRVLQVVQAVHGRNTQGSQPRRSPRIKIFNKSTVCFAMANRCHHYSETLHCEGEVWHSKWAPNIISGPRMKWML